MDEFSAPKRPSVCGPAVKLLLQWWLMRAVRPATWRPAPDCRSPDLATHRLSTAKLIRLSQVAHLHRHRQCLRKILSEVAPSLLSKQPKPVWQKPKVS